MRSVQHVSRSYCSPAVSLVTSSLIPKPDYTLQTLVRKQHSMALLQAGVRSLRAGSASLLPQLQQLRYFAVVPGDDSHDDFKPKYKQEPASDADEQIKNDISSNQVFIYMKGTPDAPQCGFSNMACRILDAYQLEYGSRNVLADAGIREGIKTFTGWPTIPQVFVKGEFIGGSDILMEMHKAGELNELAEQLAAESEKQE